MQNLPSLAAPIMCHLFEKYPDAYLEQLEQAGVKFVWLAPVRWFNPQKWEEEINRFTSCAKILEDKGYEVGFWIQSFGFGTPIPEAELPFTKSFQQITDLDGNTNGDAFCPLSPDYSKYVAESIKSSARAGAKLIMLDDDMCLNIRPGLSCACERHMADFEKRLGYKPNRKTLKNTIYSGKPTPERKAWLESQGDSMRKFCSDMRKALDEVNPEARLGFCAGFTSWDLEGADALELTKILAGKTKPFLRLTGAPYWAEVRRFAGQTMAHIVEFTRMQIEWCHNSGVDVFYENDTYPRPTYKIPAALMETFDFCLAADGCIDQLKYIFDYFSSPDYEKGYLKAHLHNKDLIKSSYESLKSLESLGVYVHEDMHKFADMSLPEDFKGDAYIMHTAFSAAADLLSGVGISTTYKNNGGVTAAFGDAARTVPLDQKAYILDGAAATELQKRGVDTGILNIDIFPIPRFDINNTAPLPCLEAFERFNDDVEIGYDDFIPGTSDFYRVKLNDNAAVESWFTVGEEKIPASYSYKNKEGKSFLVFLFRADSFKLNSSLACSYYRQEQIADFLARENAPVPAVIKRAPNLWMLCKGDQSTLAIAICNFSIDMMIDPEVELGENYASVEFIGLNGRLEGDRVKLDTIPAYQFGVVILKK